MMRFFTQGSILLSVAILLALLSNALASSERRLGWLSSAPSPPRPVPGATAAAPSADFRPHPDRPWIEISPDQAKSLFDRGTIFFDARRSAVYREGHVRGARPISVWESDADERVKSFLDEGHDPNAPIVVYCSGGDCEDSHELAQKLWGVTFDNVYVYKDGFPDWQKRGWPVETGGGK
jgi:rhodanese-related sulfurtransferase